MNLSRIYTSPLAKAGAYLLLVVLAAAGFAIVTHQNDKINQQNVSRRIERIKTTNDLCTQSKISREGLRDSITSFVDFAKGLIPPGQESTPGNKAFIARLDAYQAERLKKYPPVTCKLAVPK